MLNSSESPEKFGHIVWPIFYCYVISMFAVYICIKNGIKTSGKISIVTASSPYVLLIILMIRGLMLDGAKEGLIWLIKPDLNKLFSLSVWVDAA